MEIYIFTICRYNFLCSKGVNNAYGVSDPGLLKFFSGLSRSQKWFKTSGSFIFMKDSKKFEKKSSIFIIFLCLITGTYDDCAFPERSSELIKTS
jgi:hypothetical protein